MSQERDGVYWMSSTFFAFYPGWVGGGWDLGGDGGSATATPRPSRGGPVPYTAACWMQSHCITAHRSSARLQPGASGSYLMQEGGLVSEASRHCSLIGRFPH
ncbi:hypothetical protein N658DRAFT_108751 [Parathielavia hyrcaniae]|uniref:Uncharacterized protein n=1 Tax=Parathielavia hyrcaniae TaxID=113614 RepID=A0AAN6PYT5_9PEZI|nr:hypothetical protein N658DRAFT_108751 [Parathielavia hyrcaniae]